MAPLSTVATREGRRLATWAIFAGAGFFFVKTVAAKLLHAMLYHPSQYREDPSHDRMVSAYTKQFNSISYQLDEVDYSLPSGSNGLPQRVYLLHPKNPPVGNLWMFFGGNAMLGADWFDFCLTMLQAHPAEKEAPAFILLDYPGYGFNDGQASPKTVLQGQKAALDAALPYLASPPGKLHLLGHSLGAAAAAQLASQYTEASKGQDCEAKPGIPLGRLVLSAPFMNIDAMAQAIFGERLLPSWLLKLLLTEHWDNSVWVPKAAKAGWDVSIIHGGRDELVPTWMGRTLHKRVEESGRSSKFVEVAKSGHNDLLGFSHHYAQLMGFRR